MEPIGPLEISSVPNVLKLPGQSWIWSVCPMSCLENKIYLDCPGILSILRQTLAVEAQGRPLNFIKCRKMTLSSSKYNKTYSSILFSGLCTYE